MLENVLKFIISAGTVQREILSRAELNYCGWIERHFIKFLGYFGIKMKENCFDYERLFFSVYLELCTVQKKFQTIYNL